MNLNKLREALKEIGEERARLTDLANGLEALISQQEQTTVSLIATSAPGRNGNVSHGLSYVDMAATYLKFINKPAHISSIVAYIRQTKNDDKIKRGSVEATIIRHMKAKGEKSRIIKIGPGRYGLPSHARMVLPAVEAHAARPS